MAARPTGWSQFQTATTRVDDAISPRRSLKRPCIDLNGTGLHKRFVGHFS